MTKGIIIGVLVYSLILTIVFLYKDNSSYFAPDDLDAVLAGPVLWLYLLFLLIVIKPIYQVFFKNKKKKEVPYKPESDRYIQKIVKKVVHNYLRHRDYLYYFDFAYYRMPSDYYNIYYGYDDLLVKSPRYERLNSKFIFLMFNEDKDRTIKELKKYFVRVDENFMRKNGDSEWVIMDSKDKELYMIPIEKGKKKGRK
jgi:hypothetical protein